MSDLFPLKGKEAKEQLDLNKNVLHIAQTKK